MSLESQVGDLRDSPRKKKTEAGLLCVVVAVAVVSVVFWNTQIETAVNHFLSTYQKR